MPEDHRFKIEQQVQTAVDIADGVNNGVVRDAGTTAGIEGLEKTFEHALEDKGLCAVFTDQITPAREGWHGQDVRGHGRQLCRFA
jgi:hypothetical protein